MARTLLVRRSDMVATRRARSNRTRMRAYKSGFTLVELAVVVTIVGVLSVIAVVGYRRMVLSSKLTEAENFVSAIRIAQEAYKTERGIYANIGSTPCPSNGLGNQKVQWNPNCNGGTMTWATLPVHADGALQFGYTTVAGPPGAPPATFVNTSAMDATRPWYIITAVADLNNDGASGMNTEMVGTSATNTLFSRNVGE